jgi:hypothetical protein
MPLPISFPRNDGKRVILNRQPKSLDCPKDAILTPKTCYFL